MAGRARTCATALAVLGGCGSPAQDGDSGFDNVTATAAEPTAGDDASVDASDEGNSEDESGAPPTVLDVGHDPDQPPPEMCDQDVDVVFVMDVSTTMGPFLATLSDEILAVDQALAGYDLPSAPHYGLAVFVDDAALLNTGTPYADVSGLQADFVTWGDFTASNQQVGGGNSNSTWEENSLDALALAAAGFQWRPAETTLRVIIHTTDDTFWDGPTTGNGVSIVNSYADTVDALQGAQIRVFSFADDIGGSCECEDVTSGWSTPYMGSPSIPEATDGGVFAIGQILSGAVSLSDAIASSVESSICDPYNPVG